MSRRLISQRMQTNSDWSSVFKFVVGLPPIPQNLSTWIIEGVARRENLPSNYVPLAIGTRLALGEDPSQLTISLSSDDTQALGAGRVVFEILRISPVPQRPILKFYIENNLGVAPNE